MATELFFAIKNWINTHTPHLAESQIVALITKQTDIRN